MYPIKYQKGSDSVEYSVEYEYFILVGAPGQNRTDITGVQNQHISRYVTGALYFGSPGRI